MKKRIYQKSGQRVNNTCYGFLNFDRLECDSIILKAAGKISFRNWKIFLEVMKDVNRLKAVIFHAEPKLAHIAYNYSHFNMLR